jgi:hypothetical protein
MRVEDDWNIVLTFDSDDPEFTRGVEVGMVWTIVANVRPTVPVDCMMHASNAEMAIRIGECLRRNVKARFVDDNWMDVCFEAVR